MSAHKKIRSELLPEKIIAIDWSGRKGSDLKRHIWAGVWHEGRIELHSGRTREELIDWVIEQSKITPKLVVGVDFCFSYPAWFLQELGVKSAIEFWDIVRDQYSEHWLGKDCNDIRLWGRPRKKPREFHKDVDETRMFRLADLECKSRNLSLQRAAQNWSRELLPNLHFKSEGLERLALEPYVEFLCCQH